MQTESLKRTRSAFPALRPSVLSTTLSLVLPAVLYLLPSPALAIYKCETPGSVVYSDLPCPHGEVMELDNLQPNDRKAATRRAAKNKALLKQLQNARRSEDSEESNQAKEQRRAAKAQAALEKRCEKLALQEKWAAEDAASATVSRVDHARRKAQRAHEKYEMECSDRQQNSRGLIGVGSGDSSI